MLSIVLLKFDDFNLWYYYYYSNFRIAFQVRQ